MKRLNILLFFILLLTGFMYSCYDDKGNYDYQWIPEVILTKKVGHFSDTTIKRGQRLTITPHLKLLLKNNENKIDTTDFRPGDFSYKWTAYLRSTKESVTVLATTQNLDTTINLSLQDKAYIIVYSVTENSSGVTYNFNFNLRVENRYANAWLFLTEDNNGETDITLYGKELGNTSENPWVFEDKILERSGFPYRGKGAKFVYYYSALSRIYVGTGEATGWIGKNDLTWNDKQLVRYQMASIEPVNFTFENIERYGSGLWHFIASNGNIYPMGNSHILMSAYNILPPALSELGKYETVQMAPFVGSTGMYNCVYDETNKKMWSYVGSAGSPALTVKAVADASKLLNHKLYHMQGWGNTEVSVVAKDLQTDKYYHYILEIPSGSLKIVEKTEIKNGHLLDEADGYIERTKQYVCDNLKGNFYMAYGNKLYVLRDDMLKEVTILDQDGLIEGQFNGLDPICLMTRYLDIQSTRSYIMVATYNTGVEKSGKVYFLEPNSVEPAELTIKTYYKDMGRIKGISRF